jgi:hypothetical protein
MASLANGLLLPASPRLFLSPRPVITELLSSASRPRYFASSSILRSAAPHTRSAKPQSSLTKGLAPPAATTTRQPTGYAVVKNLATKPTPTILYESGSQFWFYFGCWTSGLSILAWTGLTGPQIVFQPEGVPQFVGWVYGISYALLGSMGFYILSKTPSIVRTIRVLPARAAQANATPRPAPASARQVRQETAPQLQMEVTVNRVLPFIQPKVITTTLDKVSLTSRFSLPDEYVPELKRQEQQRNEEEKRKKLREFDMNHLLTMPFRRLARAFVAMFRGVRAAWTDMGYGVMVVDGKSYKVNVVKGFAHDGFRTLERIVPVKAK